MLLKQSSNGSFCHEKGLNKFFEVNSETGENLNDCVWF
jgi:uncharacterized protein (DUF427 family)